MFKKRFFYSKEEDRIVRKEIKLLKENLEKPSIQAVSECYSLFCSFLSSIIFCLQYCCNEEKVIYANSIQLLMSNDEVF